MTFVPFHCIQFQIYDKVFGIFIRTERVTFCTIHKDIHRSSVFREGSTAGKPEPDKVAVCHQSDPDAAGGESGFCVRSAVRLKSFNHITGETATSDTLRSFLHFHGPTHKVAVLCKIDSHCFNFPGFLYIF